MAYAGDGSQQPWGYLLPLQVGPPLELRQDCTAVGTSRCCSLQVGSVAEDSPQVLFEVRRFEGSALLRSEALEVRVDGQRIERGRPVRVEHGARVSFAGDLKYVYLNREQSESFTAPPKVLAEYLVGHCLGEGGFGKVYVLFDKELNYQCGALKIVQPASESQVRYAAREARILLSLEHPCVIETFNVEQLGYQQFLIMEYMAGGDLREFVNGHVLSEQETKVIFFQLAIAVEYLHENEICHRDLKPANILLQRRCPNTLIKVTDFGLAKCGKDDTIMTTFLGTQEYMAPEILDVIYTKSVDVWSMGVILFQILSGELPFRSFGEARNRKHVVKYDRSRWRNLSLAQKLVKRMLLVEAAERVSASQVTEDPWLNDDAMREDVFRLTRLEKYRPNSRSPFGYLLPLYNDNAPIELRNTSTWIDVFEWTRYEQPPPLTCCYMRVIRDESRETALLYSDIPLFSERKIVDMCRPALLEHAMHMGLRNGDASYVYVDAKASDSLKTTEIYKDEYWMAEIKKCQNEGCFTKEFVIFEKKRSRKIRYLKVVHPFAMNRVQFERDANVLLTLKHPCLIETFSIRNLWCDHFLIMDYMGGGTLSEYVNNYKWPIFSGAKYLFFQLALAVKYLHERNISYCYLSPRNVLLRDYLARTLLKLSTFDLMDDSFVGRSSKKSKESVLFIAPEFTDKRNPHTSAVDVYSMGMILFYCLAGELPSKHVRGLTYSDYPECVPNEARALVSSMLKEEPSDRPSASRVVDDAWLQDEEMREDVFKLTGLDDIRPQRSWEGSCTLS